MSPSRVYTAKVAPERFVPRSMSKGVPLRGATPTGTAAAPPTDFTSA
jgi:hypothetical protein